MQGLGFQSIALTKQVPPFFNLVNANALNQNAFSLWLNPNQSAEVAGELVFGGVNAKFFQGPLITLPVSKEG